MTRGGSPSARPGGGRASSSSGTTALGTVLTFASGRRAVRAAAIPGVAASTRSARGTTDHMSLRSAEIDAPDSPALVLDSAA